MGPSWPGGGWPGERCVASASRAQTAEPRRQCLPGYWLGYGISALFACEGLLTVGGPEMRHVVIDPHQDTRFAALGPQALGEAGVAGLVEFHSEQSQIVLPLLLARGRRFDMAAIATTGRFCAPALAPTPGRSTTWWRQAHAWYPMSLPGPAAALLPMRAARLFVSGPPLS